MVCGTYYRRVYSTKKSAQGAYLSKHTPVFHLHIDADITQGQVTNEVK